MVAPESLALFGFGVILSVPLTIAAMRYFQLNKEREYVKATTALSRSERQAIEWFASREVHKDPFAVLTGNVSGDCALPDKVSDPDKLSEPSSAFSPGEIPKDLSPQAIELELELALLQAASLEKSLKNPESIGKPSQTRRRKRKRQLDVSQQPSETVSAVEAKLQETLERIKFLSTLRTGSPQPGAAAQPSGAVKASVSAEPSGAAQASASTEPSTTAPEREQTDATNAVSNEDLVVKKEVLELVDEQTGVIAATNEALGISVAGLKKQREILYQSALIRESLRAARERAIRMSLRKREEESIRNMQAAISALRDSVLTPQKKLHKSVSRIIGSLDPNVDWAFNQVFDLMQNSKESLLSFACAEKMIESRIPALRVELERWKNRSELEHEALSKLDLDMARSRVAAYQETIETSERTLSELRRNYIFAEDAQSRAEMVLQHLYVLKRLLNLLPKKKVDKGYRLTYINICAALVGLLDSANSLESEPQADFMKRLLDLECSVLGVYASVARNNLELSKRERSLIISEGSKLLPEFKELMEKEELSVQRWDKMRAESIAQNKQFSAAVAEQKLNAGQTLMKLYQDSVSILESIVTESGGTARASS